MELLCAASYGWQWEQMEERERRRVQMGIIKRGVEKERKKERDRELKGI